MKILHVSCAIIEKDGLVLVAQRSKTMSLPLKWEFPGGKLDPNENAENCLVREIKEELGVDINILSSQPPSDWQYSAFAIILYPFVCNLGPGKISLADHKAISWVKPVDLLDLDWAEADIPVVQNYLAHLSGGVYVQ
ncbi:MAG: (deoxy)nucleoside triphosphate pyrophosphohydrolase [Deltaproteobacteria bacterium]|nr:(deoxy)nucleoside triphosphate pyrophosphohydrolase [Deltaproteobacteria bacterium]